MFIQCILVIFIHLPLHVPHRYFSTNLLSKLHVLSLSQLSPLSPAFIDQQLVGMVLTIKEI